ncbi:5'-3' exoribonuclease 2 [Caerostris darwini]|uniref:5'-3' exoribonuclease n=1 Tax=Caerostris darwini TaxID=1538125 RepID=A0AAV4VUH0_9ARAC|nr:5'-3' exoribonuclease 2 [Caerostris darwini]
MGVPAFFRWLSRKYPSIVVHCNEEKPKIVNGVKIPVDTSQPNPNNVEFDNLYLDMNGIIHPCCHPENKPAPKDEEEMMIAIFEYIDRIFSIVRPRRLLYMAIDGVAPRAKMNQQRSRRFRASKETTEKVDLISQLRQELMVKGINLPPEKPKEDHFDSNCITPGTPFMDRLAKCLHYYIHDRLNSDPGWRNIEVILSDANVPGEGEHKIMDFIRRQRSNPEHDANTRHCLCGADADLIMLGLATHEPNFTIIREEFKPNQPRPCELCGQIGHEMKECTGAAKEKQGEFDELTKPIEIDVEFIFIRLNVLREYLAKELVMENLPFEFDLERVIDDWVFMCFFVGNDFLPHLPSLEIREGAIDRLVELYKKAVYKTGGYVTKSGHVELSRVQLIMTDLGDVEDEIFKRRQESELSFRARQKDRKKRMKMNRDDRPAWTPGGQFSPMSASRTPSPVQNPRQEAYQMRMSSSSSPANQNSRQKLESMLRPENSDADSSSGVLGMKRQKEESESEEEPEPEDDVKLWEDGWKERYYEVKFKVDREDIEFRHKVAAAYVEGLCWVLRYYYQGCASWNWYFPYHYAPFASDFVNIGDLKINFELGKPFNPLEQLMAVFPAASKQHVPAPWGDLMSDPDSPIIDFYPIDFKVDLNGKKYAWQGVALLPFVDEKRLLKAVETVYPLLSPEEVKRNVRGKDRLYIRNGHSGYEFLVALYENGSNWKLEIDMNPKLFSGMGGKVILSEDVIHPKETIKSPVHALPDLAGNAAVCVSFVDPQYPENFIFPAERLKSAVDPPKVLRPGQTHVPDYRNRNNFRRPQVGMAPSSKRAYLDSSGHRMIGHNMRDRNSGYGNVPPPNSYSGRHHPRGGYSSYGPPQAYSSGVLNAILIGPLHFLKFLIKVHPVT